ncbi:DinB family protein [Streptomyces sp. TLI_171]|uniref:DinB family protein n=1 Tax=Streptomyces sp. TLI_171 TaxID=1938859 RepID=UPI000C178F8A|nr:DinB family protein [Streptomyces sp. TLI_171]RKE18223.1 DinB family protein [Streptomyces sp. TLI_171]
MFDPAPLHRAYQDVTAAAEEAARAEPAALPPGEWTAEQVLAHLALVTAGTLAAVATAAAGSPAGYDNRSSQDHRNIGRVIHGSGGGEALRRRVAGYGAALGGLAASLGAEELAAPVPAVLFSHGKPLFEGVLTVRGLLDGLAGTELPAHAAQIRATAGRPAARPTPAPFA